MTSPPHRPGTPVPGRCFNRPYADRAPPCSNPSPRRLLRFFPAPVALLSQVVDGDEDGFDLALLEALTAHRDHHRVADRATELTAPLSLDVLALACHARRHRGWAVRIESPCLPARLLRDRDSSHGR
ncbi:immunity 49 family protein [Kitasatospora sp. NPDC057738]|uniref:immunity 49 family protein n=1 Tax=Kitasatospora sp. NPDC057738 TaxID=3346233 RepID=UPI0036978D85